MGGWKHRGGLRNQHWALHNYADPWCKTKPRHQKYPQVWNFVYKIQENNQRSLFTSSQCEMIELKRTPELWFYVIPIRICDSYCAFLGMKFISCIGKWQDTDKTFIWSANAKKGERKPTIVVMQRQILASDYITYFLSTGGSYDKLEVWKFSDGVKAPAVTGEIVIRFHSCMVPRRL